MQLLTIVSQSRRDFKGKYKCEYCGHIEIDNNMDSYDDDNYHKNVIPTKKCSNCGKSTLLENGKVADYTLKYSPEEIV